MSIISFSNAVGLPLRAVSGPAQALVPWVTRIRQSLERLAAQSCKAGLAAETGGVVSSRGITLASNDALFSPRFDLPINATFPAARKAAAMAPASNAAAACSASLRVVREADSAIASDCAGRMVISGRMADVCAELDRMEQRASAQGNL